jgi:diguanylate cyclase (GGDEF)-like protein
MEINEHDLLLELKRYKLLLHSAEKFHSSMDKETILMEIIETLKEVYPEYKYFLLLSQDNSSSNLHIINLEYKSKNLSAMQAYLSGTIQLEQSSKDNDSILYVPLKGKQGVYGVLQVTAPNTVEFPANEIEFINSLTRSAGSALENAELYQQSRQAIFELKIINETSHQLNSNLRLVDTMRYMSKQIQQTLKGQEVGFFLFSQDESKVKVLPGSTSFFLKKQAGAYIEYVKRKIQTEEESIFITDFELSDFKDVKNYCSIMAVPMFQSKILKGFTIVMHKEPFFFSFESFKMLQSLIYPSSLALANSMLREELEQMIITDHLTKLHSRNYLDEKIQHSMKNDDEGTFLLIDLDNFKGINDTFGHQIGDEVLIQVANLIKSNIRGNDVGARWGGEELALYLPNVSLEAGVTIAKRLVEKVAESSYPSITVSCGVSHWKKDRIDTYNYLFKRADEALYIAKGTGKNKVVIQKTGIKAS